MINFFDEYVDWRKSVKGACDVYNVVRWMIMNIVDELGQELS